MCRGFFESSPTPSPKHKPLLFRSTFCFATCVLFYFLFWVFYDFLSTVSSFRRLRISGQGSGWVRGGYLCSDHNDFILDSLEWNFNPVFILRFVTITAPNTCSASWHVVIEGNHEDITSTSLQACRKGNFT